MPSHTRLNLRMHGLLAVAILGCSWQLTLGQPTDIAAQKVKLASKVKSAKASLAKVLDEKISKISQSPGDPDVKLARIKELEKDKAALKEDGKLPESDSMRQSVLNYLIVINKARRPLALHYAREIDKALLAKDTNKASALSKEKAELDDILGGLDKFVQGSSWSGSRFYTKGSLGCEVKVTNLVGGVFEGEVVLEQVGGAKSSMVFQGKLDGNHLTFLTTKSKIGSFRVMRFDGFVFEGRLVGTLTEPSKGKKSPATQSWLELRTSR